MVGDWGATFVRCQGQEGLPPGTQFCCDNGRCASTLQNIHSQLLWGVTAGEGTVATEEEWWVLVCPEHPPPSVQWGQEQCSMVHSLGWGCLERSQDPHSHPQGTACSPTILSPSGQASSDCLLCHTPKLAFPSALLVLLQRLGPWYYSTG